MFWLYSYKTVETYFHCVYQATAL